jgi:transposase
MASRKLAAGPASNNHHPPQDRLPVEAPVQLLGRNLAFTLVEHFYITAERESGNRPLGAILAQRRAQSGRPKPTEKRRP